MSYEMSSTSRLRLVVTYRFCAVLLLTNNNIRESDSLIYSGPTRMPVNVRPVSLETEPSLENGQIHVAKGFEKGNIMEHDPVDWSSWLTPEALDNELST
jgi:hypothetical protein